MVRNGDAAAKSLAAFASHFYKEMEEDREDQGERGENESSSIRVLSCKSHQRPKAAAAAAYLLSLTQAL